MHTREFLVAGAAAGASLLFLPGCDNEVADDIRETVDDAADNAGDAIDDAADEIGDAVHDATH